ncbi:MAG: putative transporter, permease protein [Rhodospirillales bacterium]|nr:putative transporter, permease protein [Rhodospirillales bacterium]
MRKFLPLTLARRELRAGAKGFRILIACLALGVGTIASVQSLSRDVLGGIESQGRTLLGGDLAIRMIYHGADTDQLGALNELGAVSASADLRGMARTEDDAKSTLVEVKAVDTAYPMVGKVEFAAPSAERTLPQAFAQKDGSWGVAVDQAVLDRLAVHVGDKVKLGTLDYEIRAVITKEPDKIGTGGFTLGPRFLISQGSLAATGLEQPGSMIYYDYRILLKPGLTVDAVERDLHQRFGAAGWHIRDSRDAAPEIRNFVTRLATFLTLVGLTALLVGGVGVGNAVKSYLDGRIAVIATMKCLGASGRTIAWTYLIQVMALSAVGIAIGIAIGALMPWALRDVIADNFPITVSIAVHPSGLALAALYGGLIALGFSLWPIGRARAVPAGTLFRELTQPNTGRPDPFMMIATGTTLAVLVALVLLTSSQMTFAAGFAGGAMVAFGVLGVAARGLATLARRIGRMSWVRHQPTLRLALANLTRPGAATVSVVLSLGLGLTILVAIAQVETDFRGEIERVMPAEAPAFFFLDIQHADRDGFQTDMSVIPGVTKVETVPSLRGRIVMAHGMPAEKAIVDKRYAWVLGGDRGITYSAGMPPRSHLILGEWWPADYHGPPEVSIAKEVMLALGLKIGDELTFNIVGRDLTAKVANVREIDWGGMGINFSLVFAPGFLEGAPQTEIATAYAPRHVEPAIEQVVNKSYPGITMIGVRDALATVDNLIGEIGTAVRLTAAVALIAGTLVLAGAIAAGERRRIYDAVVLKVLGATRGTIVRAFLVEHGLLGLMSSLIAIALGSLASWAVIVPVMDLHWRFSTMTALGVAAIAAFITLAFGLVGTWRALGQRAAPLLRNE